MRGSRLLLRRAGHLFDFGGLLQAPDEEIAEMRARLGSTLGNRKRGEGRLDAFVTALVRVSMECRNEFGPLSGRTTRETRGGHDQCAIGAQYFTCAISSTFGVPIAPLPLGVTCA